MSVPDDAEAGPAETSGVSLELFTMAVGDPTRWRILAILAEGQPMMVMDVAKRIGRKSPAVSKQLALLRKAGLVEIAYGRLHRIPPRYLVDPAQGLVDYGRALLRLKAG